MLVSCFADSSTLKVKARATCSSKTLVDVQRNDVLIQKIELFNEKVIRLTQ
jgi:hypothetical protein